MLGLSSSTADELNVSDRSTVAETDPAKAAQRNDERGWSPTVTLIRRSRRAGQGTRATSEAHANV